MINHLRKHAGLLACGLLLGAGACTDLTEHPYNVVTAANFKPKAADIGQLLAPVYSPLNAWMGWYGFIDTEEESADALLTPVRPNGWYDGGTYIRMHQHRWDANEGQPNSVYTTSFNGINAANRVIYQIESGLIPVEDPLKTATLAELHAARAYYYYMLLDNQGNVPLVTDFLDTDLPSQVTRDSLYRFVVAELIAATPNLGTDPVTTYARMNKWVAEALLAKVYLNAEVYTGTAQYAKVIPLTQDIIAGGKYQLDAAYRTPFSRNNNTASKEDMWNVPYDATFNATEDFHDKTLKPELAQALGLATGGWGGSASSPQFISTYDVDDGRLNDSWLIGPHYDATGQYGYTFVKQVPRIDSTDFGNGYPVWKYEIYTGETGASDVDYPIIRYADVLMMQAEALLRTGQPGAGALVTQVRARNFKGAAAAKATVTDAQLMQGSVYNYGWSDVDGVVKDHAGGTATTNGGADVVYGRFLDELGWEFAIEGHRRSDMIRFKTTAGTPVYTTKTWFNHTPNGAYRSIFPIPQSRLNTNSKLVQNPGY